MRSSYFNIKGVNLLLQRLQCLVAPTIFHKGNVLFEPQLGHILLYTGFFFITF